MTRSRYALAAQPAPSGVEIWYHRKLVAACGPASTVPVVPSGTVRRIDELVPGALRRFRSPAVTLTVSPTRISLSEVRVVVAVGVAVGVLVAVAVAVALAVGVRVEVAVGDGVGVLVGGTSAT